MFLPTRVINVTTNLVKEKMTGSDSIESSTAEAPKVKDRPKAAKKANHVRKVKPASKIIGGV